MERSYELYVGGKVIATPCFFPSISSIKTNLLPVEYLEFLVSIRFPYLLISAYDIHHASSEDRSAVQDMLARAYEGGTIILLDSGNYESFWHQDDTWSIETFEEICRTVPSHLTFCFDNQGPPSSSRTIAEDVVARVIRTGGVFPKGTVLPIIHAPKASLPEVAVEVVDRLRPIMLAIPERELGEGLVERAETIIRIRSAMNRADYYCPLHLLGTGNPLSILVYTKCGADSFDGLEWCQTCVHHTTAILYHFQQLDFTSDHVVSVQDLDLPYSERVMLNNLLFFGKWLGEISLRLRTNCWAEFASKYLPQRIVSQLTNTLSRC